MKSLLLAGAGALMLTSFTAAFAQAPYGDNLGFLERRNMTTPQDRPLPMAETSAAVMEHNKQVVLDFYKIISDKRAWTAENAAKYFAPDFVQHDPAEPNTSADFFAFFQTMGPPAGAGGPGGPGGKMPPRRRMVMLGKTSNDSNGSPVNWEVAEGNIVVVARHRNWAWPNGPEPVYSGIFVDIWRLRDGKITDQWCSCTPADANLVKIFAAQKAGKFPKTPE